MKHLAFTALVLGITIAGAGKLPSAGAALIAQIPADDPPTVFRIDTRLVQVDVVVRDDEGPVEGLTINDFTLFDDGEQRELGFFEITRASTSEAANRPRPAVATGTTSNRPQAAGDQPTSATILLLDRLNTEVMDQPRANRQALEFLESLDGNHEVAIYELRGQLRLIQDYTRDRERLIQAALALETNFSSQLGASYGTNATGGFEATGNDVGIDPDLVDARTGGGIEERGTADLDQQVAAYYINNRVRVTADVLEALATSMSSLAGRKNLIWLSGRFPFSFEPHSRFLPDEVSSATMDQLERTARAITDANVAIYPVSAVGLLAPTFNDPAVSPTASTATRRRAQFSRTIAGGGDRLATEPSNANSMEHIAETTGGEAHYLTNGIAEAIGEAVGDADLVYTLGFYLDATTTDSDFHELRVEVARDRVNVRHRRGYYGFAAREGQRSEGQRAVNTVPISSLVTSPVNATEIGMTAVAAEDGETTSLYLNPNDLEMGLRDGIWYGAVEVATLLVERDSEPPNIEVGNLIIALTEEQLRNANRGHGYEAMRLGAGQTDTAWFRIAVRDLVSGRAGSLWIVLD